MNQADYDLMRQKVLSHLIEDKKILNGHHREGNPAYERANGVNMLLEEIAGRYHLEYRPITKADIDMR
jgi:hypothetical protein